MGLNLSRSFIGSSIQIFALGVSLASCTRGPSASGSAGVTAANSSMSSDSVIRIGEVGSMTGNDASFGQSTHRGVQLAVDQANSAGGIAGKKVEVSALDDLGQASEAVLAITNLIQQHRVQAVLGEVASTLSIAMASIAQKSKIPMITPSSINTKVTKQGDFIFRVCFLDTFQSEVMADFARTGLNAQTVAILKDTKSDYSRDSSEYFVRNFVAKGGKVLLQQSYTGGDIDFQSQLTAIRAVNPDVVLVPGYYTDIALIARQAKALGIKAPLLGGDAWDSPLLHEIGGPAVEGSYFVGHFYAEDSNPRVQQFVQAFRKAYKISPDGIAALGYDAAVLLLDSMKRMSTQENTPFPVRLRNAIAETRDFQGVTGSIGIDANRNAVKAAYVFKIERAGKLKVVGTYPKTASQQQ